MGQVVTARDTIRAALADLVFGNSDRLADDIANALIEAGYDLTAPTLAALDAAVRAHRPIKRGALPQSCYDGTCDHDEVCEERTITVCRECSRISDEINDEFIPDAVLAANCAVCVACDPALCEAHSDETTPTGTVTAEEPEIGAQRAFLGDVAIPVDVARAAIALGLIRQPPAPDADEVSPMTHGSALSGLLRRVEALETVTMGLRERAGVAKGSAEEFATEVLDRLDTLERVIATDFAEEVYDRLDGHDVAVKHLAGRAASANDRLDATDAQMRDFADRLDPLKREFKNDVQSLNVQVQAIRDRLAEAVADMDAPQIYDRLVRLETVVGEDTFAEEVTHRLEALERAMAVRESIEGNTSDRLDRIYDRLDRLGERILGRWWVHRPGNTEREISGTAQREHVFDTGVRCWCIPEGEGQ